MSEVVWTERALAHLEAIRAYINQFNPQAARRVADSLKTLGDSLSHFPERGRPVPGTRMREVVSTFPYPDTCETARIAASASWKIQAADSSAAASMRSRMSGSCR